MDIYNFMIAASFQMYANHISRIYTNKDNKIYKESRILRLV